LYRNVNVFIFLFFIFTMLNVLDGHSTYLVVSNSNLTSERNPFARFLFRKMGLKTGIISLKSFSVLLILVSFIFIKDLRYELNLVLAIANSFYIFVVVNNYRNYRKIIKNREQIRKLEELACNMKK
jgi:hypothetical protein